MKKSYIIEVLFILAAWAALAALLSKLGAYEALYDFSRMHESWELDELVLSLPLLLLFLSISFGLKLRRITDLEAKARHSQRKLEAAHEQVLDAQRLKDEFLTNSAHELRTPLNGTIGMLDLLGDTPLDAEQAEYVRIASASARQLSNLLGDVLFLARMQSAPGAAQEPNVLFSPAGLLEQVLEAFMPLARDAGVVLAVDPDTALDELYLGNMAAIRQIVFNLTGNALKFTTQGRVDISAGFEPGEGRKGVLRVAVSDTGPGIEAGELEHIFEPFVHRDGDAARSREGVGLGLSIVRRLADSIGARVSLVSIPGQGSVFTLNAPVERRDDGDV